MARKLAVQANDEQETRRRSPKRRSWTPIPVPNEEEEGEEDVDPLLLPPEPK